jgi:hypothetical protein
MESLFNAIITAFAFLGYGMIAFSWTIVLAPLKYFGWEPVASWDWQTIWMPGAVVLGIIAAILAIILFFWLLGLIVVLIFYYIPLWILGIIIWFFKSLFSMIKQIFTK